MTNFVQITSNSEGQIVVASTNNPDYGYVRVQAETISFVDGWMRKAVRSALIKGKVSDLEAFKTLKQIPGKIVIKESTTPFYEGQSPKINPSTGEVLTVNGDPIYRESVFTQDVNATDSLVQHTNVNVAVAAKQENI